MHNKKEVQGLVQTSVSGIIGCYIILEQFFNSKYIKSKKLFEVFKLVWLNDKISLTELREKLQTTKSAITNQLYVLEQFGLLKKEWNKMERNYSIHKKLFNPMNDVNMQRIFNDALELASDFDSFETITGIYSDAKESEDIISILSSDYYKLLNLLQKEKLSNKTLSFLKKINKNKSIIKKDLLLEK